MRSHRTGRLPLPLPRHRRGRTLWTRSVVAASLLLVSTTRASAQARETVSRFDHWRTIDAVTADIGGMAALSSATAPQISRLADQLLQRGQAYLDLYEFQRILVRDHAMMLDSIAKVGGPRFGAAGYFKARALHEAGNVREATTAYRAAATSAPLVLRSLAAEWLASLNGAPSARWQQDLAEWRAGRPSKSTACPVGQRQCTLLRAMIAEDVGAITRLQHELTQRPLADYTETQRGRDGDVTVEFFDPLTLYLLGAADFVVAAKIGSGKTDTDAWRGFALLRAGRVREAAMVLKVVVDNGGARAEQLSPLLGEAEYRQNNRAGAEQLWGTASGVGLNVLADVKSGLGLDSSAVLRQLRAERQRGLERFVGGASGGTYLARALLRFNLLADAEEVLAAVRPASQGSRLSAVSPSVLALAAHAEYRRGRLPSYRDRYSFARADLADVASAAPIVGGMLRQLQQLTMTADGPATTRSFEDPMNEEELDA